MAATAMFWELFTPKPNFTEKNIPDQYGRVFIVTGGASGCGYEVAKALYNLNGRVYIAGRSKKNAEVAIAEMRESHPAADQTVQGGKGELFFLQLDLADLSTIRTSAEEFLRKEDRLDVIWHNAGVMVPPIGSETKQGYDLQFGTNVLGPFLFQHFLTPLCLKTVRMPGVQRNATRVIFVSSSGHHLSPKPDGVNWDDLNMKSMTSAWANWMKYGQSKAMNAMHAHELARQYSSQGLISVSAHPGALRTNLGRSLPWWTDYILYFIHHPPHMGALTELYAGLNGDVDSKLLDDGGRNGAYILPWGRFADGSVHVFEGLTRRKTGEKLWSVCEGMLKEYI
ncbi:MAG: hypothetical protein M1812_005233 [Candelaria pacifica]|nr:MAG: hypothetical protein M1812_005233 [Candelaria pacifica]